MSRWMIEWGFGDVNDSDVEAWGQRIEVEAPNVTFALAQAISGRLGEDQERRDEPVEWIKMTWIEKGR